MASASTKFNVRNPAVKRILQEIKELQSEGTNDFIADALEEDIFEWHFVIRGPSDSEFEGGIYHGRILLPAEYPFKPPAFMMLTPNGRFQTGVKICLSISSHHPEHWQPSWSVRTALTALIAFMPSPGQGALGSLDYTKDERKQLAIKSRSDIPKFGSAARQKVISDMHERFLQLQHAAASSSSNKQAKPAAAGTARDALATSPAAADQGAAAMMEGSNTEHAREQPQQQAIFSLSGADSPHQQEQHQQTQQQQGEGKPLLLSSNSSSSFAPASSAYHAASSPTSSNPVSQVTSPAAVAPAAVAQLQMQPAAAVAGMGAVSAPGELPGDRGLTFLAVVLAVAIAAMLLKKVIIAFGGMRPML